jgi:NTP pyrophosphatase (non-canonical NTP hydrolase)
MTLDELLHWVTNMYNVCGGHREVTVIVHDTTRYVATRCTPTELLAKDGGPELVCWGVGVPTAESKVREFHAKFGFPIGRRLEASGDELYDPCLEYARAHLEQASKSLVPVVSADDRALRLHLMTEELCEAAEALRDRDKRALVDALADLMYVVLGTAVTYGLPLELAFREVHRSNMTKTESQDRPGHPGKGEGYSPPGLENLL